MNTKIETLFCGCLDIDTEIDEFLARDTQFTQAKQEFYETANEVAQAVGFDLYDIFEQRMGAYLSRMSDLYNLFGLGFRQEVLRDLGV